MNSVLRLLILALLMVPVQGTADEVFVFRRADGSVSVLSPAAGCLASLQQAAGTPPNASQCPALGASPSEAREWIKARSLSPDVTQGRWVERGALPSRRFRNAWSVQPDGRVIVDTDSARVIRQSEIQREIAAKINHSLGVSAVLADADDAARLEAHKTYRRQLRALEDSLPAWLRSVQTVEALEAWSPTYPTIPGGLP